MKKTRNRWFIALSAVGIHISIGSVYSWSVFSKPIMAKYGWSLSDVSLTFSIAIVFLGLSAAFLGRFVERRGPHVSGLVSTCFYACGLIGAGIALSIGSLPLLYLTYGVCGGIGLGTGYITPVSTLVKWFPDNRGMATGLAIMGFGFAALIASPIIAQLITAVGLTNTFFILGAVYASVMFLSASYIAPPPEGWKPAGYAGDNANGEKKKRKADLAQLTAREAIKTKRFYYLWLMLFINITCGIGIIAVASPMGQEIAGLTAASAATMVGIMGLFNGGGRIGWASLSDYIGRPLTYMLFFLIQMVAFYLLPRVSDALLFQAILFLILTCYGGGFASVPAFIGDIFGTKQLAAIHGLILTAWSAAGVAGPQLVAWLRESTQSYTGTLTIFVGFFAVAFIISLLMLLDIRRLRAQPKPSA
ncbi:MAG TPA: OFA family MFS transporter [bacterium]|nr:OFA family MFS transporter [bacterium]